MERLCPLFSEWRLDETAAREADVLTGVVLLPPNSIGFGSLSLRELRHIGRMYLNNAFRNFNLYPYVFLI